MRFVWQLVWQSRQFTEHCCASKKCLSRFKCNCLFTIGNFEFKQNIPITIDLAPFWPDLLKHIQNLIFLGSSRAFKCYGTRRLIDDVSAIYFLNEFSNSLEYIYQKNLEYKVEH